LDVSVLRNGTEHRFGQTGRQITSHQTLSILLKGLQNFKFVELFDEAEARRKWMSGLGSLLRFAALGIDDR